ASTPQTATGTFTYTSTHLTGFRIVGENAIIDLSSQVAYTGTFSGTSVLSGTLTFHPNGKADFQDVETFTGTVNGIAGTVRLILQGGSDGPNITASATVVAATGD